MTKVAVVILNWNGAKLLQQFLPSVLEYSRGEGVEIIVADNASTDDSVQLLQNDFPTVRIVQLVENLGYAEGYNQALRQIESEYFVLLNSDVEVAENWLEPLVNYLDNNIDVQAAQPKLLAQRNKTYFEYAGASGGYLDKYGYPFCRGRIFGKVEEDKGQYDTPVDVLWATGACLFIRSKAYFETGGLDMSFFAHMEEIDLCWRINARGGRIVCVPESVVYHVGGATLDEESPRKTYLNFRNNLLMLYKNLPEKDLKSTLQVRYFLDKLAALQFRLAGKKENAKQIRQAVADFKSMKSDYDEVRKENLEKTTQANLPAIYTKSILFKFYAKGVKRFSDLKWF